MCLAKFNGFFFISLGPAKHGYSQVAGNKTHDYENDDNEMDGNDYKVTTITCRWDHVRYKIQPSKVTQVTGIKFSYFYPSVMCDLKVNLLGFFNTDFPCSVWNANSFFCTENAY